MGKIISISETSKLMCVTIATLKIWDNEGKLKAKFKTPGGHRRYDIDDIEKFIGNSITENPNTLQNAFIYCRVSTKKQQESGKLIRQKERLVNYCNEKNYQIINIYEEIASGLNDNRRELKKMFRHLDEVDKIVIEYSDRLARFGYSYLAEFAKAFNVEIEVIERSENLKPNEEMVNDLVSIVTCFSARLYGARGGKKLKQTVEKTLLELERERCDSSETNDESHSS